MSDSGHGGRSVGLQPRPGSPPGYPGLDDETRTQPADSAAQGRFDHEGVKRATRDLLIAIGEDPTREGLIDTPRRVADFWREVMEHDAGRVDTVFTAVSSDQLVIVGGMRIWSLCEHHLLPFWADVAVGYLVQDRTPGLSKIGRLARRAGMRLQLQERLVEGIADDIEVLTRSQDVAVIAEGEHLCMTMRGAAMPHRMTSSALRGEFRDGALRAEFLSLARRR